MAQVTGFEGAFLRSDDPQSLYTWYEQHLGISSRDGCFSFQGRAQRANIAVAFFPRSSDYFQRRKCARPGSLGPNGPYIEFLTNGVLVTKSCRGLTDFPGSGLAYLKRTNYG